jgi:hypothetical protein
MRQALDRLSGTILILLTVLSAAPVAAGVTVDIDARTLNQILTAISVAEVEVPISAQSTVTVELHDLRVIGFDPSPDQQRPGAILTAVRVVAPELGLEVPLEPRIAVDVVREGEASMLELRFEDLGLKIPFVGQINLASLVPPMRYPADNVFLLDGAQGDVPVTSRLRTIKMGREAIRFELDLQVSQTP